MTKANSRAMPARRDYRVLNTELPFIASPIHYCIKHRVRRGGRAGRLHALFEGRAGGDRITSVVRHPFAHRIPALELVA